MSSGTEECKEAKPAIKPNLYEEGHPETWAPTFPLGEVQYRKTGFRKLPEGINDKRVTMTVRKRSQKSPASADLPWSYASPHGAHES